MRRSWTLALTAPLVGVALLVPGPTGAQPPSPSTGPAAASPPAAPAIDWDSGEVQLTADAIRIIAGGQVFTAQVPDVQVGGDPGNASYRTLEVEWQELGREQRLYLYLAADDVSWWVTEIRTRDGSPNGEWATLPAPVFRMPIGGSYRGGLSLVGPAATLEISGLTLTAFSPDTIPAELRFCRSALPEGQDPDTTDPLAAGQPLAGTGIASMAPVGAKQVLLGLGLCHTFRYDTRFEGGGGYSELWCDPPPGMITGVRYGSDGEVIVFVRDATPQPHTPRPQPPVGWGC